MLFVIIVVLVVVGYVLVEEYFYIYSDYFYQLVFVVLVFVFLGESFEFYVKEGVLVSLIEVVLVFYGLYQLEIQGILLGEDGMIVVKVKILDDIVFDIYFLFIKIDKGIFVFFNGLKVFKEWLKEFKLVWMSDIYVIMGVKIGYVCGDYFQSNIYKFEEMCLNLILFYSVVVIYSVYFYWGMNGVILMINIGDEVDISGDMVGYKIMFDIIKDIFVVDMFVVGIKGNYDDLLMVYIQFFGLKYFYVIIGKFIIIGFDIGGDQGYLMEDQFDWMEKVFEEYKDYMLIILYYYLYFFDLCWNYFGGVFKGFDLDVDWDQIKGYFCRSWLLQEEIFKCFFEDIVKYNVLFIMSGYIYYDMYWFYIDKNGNKYYFLILILIGVFDKEFNLFVNLKYSLIWYGSNLVVIKEDGSVEMFYVNVEIKDDKVQSDFMSVFVLQRFMVFRYVFEVGIVVKFINQFDESVSGLIVFLILEGVKVDLEVMNIIYIVFGERQIVDQYYIMLNVMILQGVFQFVIDIGVDIEKLVVQIVYFQLSYFKLNVNFMVYFIVQDNFGIRDFYVVIYDENGNCVKYGKVDKFFGEFFSGKFGDIFYIVQFLGFEEGKYKIEIVVEDFYGNRVIVIKEIIIISILKVVKIIMVKQMLLEGKSICGLVVFVGFVVVLFFFRRRR